MRLTIIAPIFNEEKTLERLIPLLIELPVEKEIIVVDDASTDSSNKILQKFSDNSDIRLLYHSKNMGKGAAIVTALPQAKGNYTIIQDGDLEYNPTDIIRLLEKAEQKNSEVVFGSRILNPKSGISYFRYYWGGRLLTFLANILYRTKITDESTCYKLVKTSLLQSLNLKCRRFEFCPELISKLAKRNIGIIEIPIEYNPRSIKNGKKIRWYDGLSAIWTLIRNRF